MNICRLYHFFCHTSTVDSSLSTPILLPPPGSAFKNKGVQTLLDAIVDYMPSPLDVEAIQGEMVMMRVMIMMMMMMVMIMMMMVIMVMMMI